MTIKFREDGIMHLHYKDGILNLADSKAIFKNIRDNYPWEVCPIYATGNTFSGLDNQSRIFWGSPEVTQHCSAISMLTNTLGSKLLANFYLKLAQPSVPTCFLSTEEECINWLKQYPTTRKANLWFSAPYNQLNGLI
jgi:hypothetical protein